MHMLEDFNGDHCPPLTIAESRIEGWGFWRANYPGRNRFGNESVFDERFQNGYIRLPIGGFINHHDMPNCKAIIAEEDVL